MRPANLLPEGYRPRTAAQRAHRGHLAVIVLAALLVATLVYVLTANSVTSRKEQTLKAEQETRQAKARADELGPFGRFAQIKQTREASVTQLAAGRFDWERSMRELTRVLPADAWLTELKASSTGADSTGSSAAASKSTAPSGGTASGGASGSQPSSPTITLSGCARTQGDVATTLVRLRRLYRAQTVDLADSSKAGTEGTAPSSAGASSGATGNCGRGYNFNLSVTFGAASSGSGSSSDVPASLGGGS
jgi:Tfp pilus assembly protein PilN